MKYISEFSKSTSIHILDDHSLYILFNSQNMNIKTLTKSNIDQTQYTTFLLLPHICITLLFLEMFSSVVKKASTQSGSSISNL